ncbi:hypothetical protein GQX74_005588 [Glossina fuscipes]|nr:hypothetical protein GQX74_005588 [Glossina fuscipes]
MSEIQLIPPGRDHEFQKLSHDDMAKQPHQPANIAAVIMIVAYSKLSPQPPQVQSSLSCLGREPLEQPHEANCPSRQARAIKLVTVAAAKACMKAISGEPAKEKIIY